MASYDQKNPKHTAMITALELVVKLQYKNIDKVTSGKITTNADGSSTSVFTYSGTKAGDEFEIDATYDNSNKLTNCFLK